HVLFVAELSITIAFDVEILLRIAAAFPDWRAFFGFGARVSAGEKAQQGQDRDTRGAGQNWLDAALTVGASVIQVPAIQHSPVYPWFTIFQLMRFYRVILAVPRMKPLLLVVFGNMPVLTNMTFFLILINFIAALISVQFLRGDLGADQRMNFGTLYNAFLAVYQVFSSENWTDVLYDTAGAEMPFGQGVITVLFISGWMLFANFIVLQMFIAVINESFNIAEEAKKGKQATNYWSEYRPQEGWLRRLNRYRWIRARTIKIKVLPANLALPMQKSPVQDYAMPRADAASIVETPTGHTPGGRTRHYSRKSLAVLQKLFAGEKHNIPLTTINHVRTRRNKQATASEELTDMVYERHTQKADFVRDHPSYDKTFWIFSQKNILRRACQKLVQPASGVRVFATPQSPILYPLFQVMLLLIVIGGIVLEAIANPVYRRNYFTEHGLMRGAWFDIAESGFGFVFLAEFLIKIVADGFLFTPNVYVHSIWNLLDFVIMVGLLANVTTGLIFVGGLNRLTRSLKALRVLRIITLIDRMRTTFESLIISGVPRIVDARDPRDLMNECNDGGVGGADMCVNEFTNTVYGDVFGFAVPRVWDNPAPSTVFSFDSFRSSLLILFEIVSLEGWWMLWPAPDERGADQRHLFLVYNLLGAAVILTLFVSIIIGNFSSKTGSAFLTAAQREWIDLQKLLKRQRPSKRPRTQPTWTVRAWCYDCAVSKNGWWSWMMTYVFILHIAVLMTQTFSTHEVIDEVRNGFFLGSTSVSFSTSCMFDFVISGGSFVMTLIFRFGTLGFATQQLQKLFLVFIAFKLVERMNGLNKLFKTAVASLPIIFSLLCFWFYSVPLLRDPLPGGLCFDEVELGGDPYPELQHNGVNVGHANVVHHWVAEGWNHYMHDYAIEYPRCTNADQEENSDCGSAGWAFTLFIAWNLLSMYIFVNMFTGVIAENFSYVFQTSGDTKAITRSQMRSFKRVWAESANPKTGHLERSHFAFFFGKLSGVFEARIYPAKFSIPNIQAACKPSNHSQYSIASTTPPSGNAGPCTPDCITKATLSTRDGDGISFTDMLFLLAHHKLIVDCDALVLAVSSFQTS
ncbi:Ion transport protein-domain-containing protein, partial [Mycena olivaceomarginata]